MIPAQNPPAFPHVTQSKRAGSETIYTHVSEGMTLRDWFAGQALAGLSSDPSFFKDVAGMIPEVVLADAAYSIADAMLTERVKA